MRNETIYTLTGDVNGEPIAARLLETGYATGIYGPPGNLYGKRLLEHEEIVAQLHAMGFEQARAVSPEQFRQMASAQQELYAAWQALQRVPSYVEDIRDGRRAFENEG